MAAVDSKEKFPLNTELKPYKDFECVFALGNTKIDELGKLYRYVPADQFENDINSRHLIFVSPTLWEDPFEQRFISADLGTNYGYSQPAFACLCFTDDAYEMVAAGWRMYSTRERKTLVRVEYDVNELLNQLNGFCRKNDLQLIVSKVSYGLTKAQLRDDPVMNILGEDVRKKNKGFGLGHFFSLLSVKRKAFTFESEVRFFITGRDKELIIGENNLLPIEMDMRQVVNKVMVEPLDPKYVDQTHKNEYHMLKREIDEKYKKTFLSLGIRVVSSTLYSAIPDNVLIR